MVSETAFRTAFLLLLLALIVMRIYFMFRVRRSGGRIMPDGQAVVREGGSAFLIIRAVLFIALMAVLVMYLAGVAWINEFSFSLPVWLRWAGFVLGLISVVFWTWTQVHLDTRWSAQLQLQKNHFLVTTGPYAFMRHPLYSGMIGWAMSISALTANWLFVAVCALSIIGVVGRVPKEEQMMIDAFGDEYKTYMERTGRFFPRI